MRIWERIKINNKVFYQNEEYIVLKIFNYKDGTTYAEVQNVQTGEIYNKSLKSLCKEN